MFIDALLYVFLLDMSIDYLFPIVNNNL